jgi:hypothetical protein
MHSSEPAEEASEAPFQAPVYVDEEPDSGG